MQQTSALPQLLLGPMLRRAEQGQVCVQLVTSYHSRLCIEIEGYHCKTEQKTFRLGTHCFFHLLLVRPVSGLFSADTALNYHLLSDSQEIDLKDYKYPSQSSAQCVIPQQLQQVLHGSCRNPHHASRDSLVAADALLEKCKSEGELEPSLLLMSGDQIYADDVAGPMLLAIEQLIEVLGLYKEQAHIAQLPEDIQLQLFNRHQFLPKTPWQECSKYSFSYWFKRGEAHFTSLSAGNHLIYFQEFIACYLLNFSAVCWQVIDREQMVYQGTNPKFIKSFETQSNAIDNFVKDLPHAQRLFANIPTLMMFDDHDVTDDWNLTARWEQAIAAHNSSRRIINSGLLSYWLFQGLGNDAMHHSGSLCAEFERSLQVDVWQFKALDKALNRFSNWHYCLETTPKVVVMDTRTHRWRNEQNFNEPSGLLDWEMLMELEDTLLDHKEVILVSPAPVFGVKSIEAIQSIFNFCGQPLLVDVENWMAHEGSARKLLEIFRRPDTPKETIILSGDVHYSFCFSVQSRFGKHHNRIWQLTASGIKNEFPKKLISFLDKLDSIFYAPWSPLNYFTKRWHMEVNKHPVQCNANKQPYLVSDSAISLITLENAKLSRYQLLHHDGRVQEFSLETD
ncbi:metallophosphatase [Pseudoalteromonas sp. JBTF-M23]|uniref:Metallophosphatase n=1 Tax=Pseudoalteromonas caenipelagi TaxID=2726988 RepID=A0A849VCE3_9GAMM|nr:metallophosphatase [Pseudoalteromonas caenipelagi]NOU49447.1 metallophosphatase [Pseudoalteromonas caenipelagi]